MITGSVKSMSTNGSSFRQLLTPSSYVTLAVPILVLIIAVFTQTKVLLDYTHVICGGTWTGIDLFMGLVMPRVMRGLAPEARAEVIKRLVPVMLFLMPALASVAITAGIYLAQWEGLLNLQSPWIIAAVIIVLILTVQGFGIVMPTEIYGRPAVGMRNIKVSASQAIFQVAIIFVMANLAMA